MTEKATTSSWFSLDRWTAMLVKEFRQLARDRVTFAMIVGIPIIQLTLFGFAINTDPKHMPTAVIAADHSEFTRSLVAAMATSDYFRIISDTPDEAAAHSALAQGTAQFVVTIPPDFTSKLLRGDRPTVLIEADASDPTATGVALAAILQLPSVVARKDLTGPLAYLASKPPPFDVAVHRLYNPESLTQYNIVPGLMGVILTMTMVMMTGLSMTRERERGTMENLLATPVKPLEVMLGKIVPYIAVGYVQVVVILLAARFLFGVPMLGSLTLLSAVIILYIASLLAIGFTFSTLATNQMQAMQMTMFFFLPSILLSGFMFPFRGMPQWAQYLGQVLPLTHFLRVVRGIMLKGSVFGEIAASIWPLALILVIVSALALKRYQRTLD